MVVADTSLGFGRIDPNTDQHRLAYLTINKNADKANELIAADRSRLSALEAAEVAANSDLVPSAGVAAVTVGGVRRLPGVDARYSAFPASTVLADGRLLMVWYEGTDHATTRDGIIRAAISEDQGLTWGAAWTVLSVAGTDLRDPTVSTSTDRQTVYLTYFKATTSAAAAGFFIRRSTDQGVTFGAEVRIDAHPYAAGCSPVVQLPNGSLLAVWYGKADTGTETKDSVWRAESPDGGATWSAAVRMVDGPAAALDMQEPWAAVSGDDVVVLYRHGNSANIGRVASSNGGASWGTGAVAFAGTGRPSAVFTSSRALVVLYRAMSGSHGVMRYSRDVGLSWSAPRLLERSNPNFWLYSGPVEVSRGQIFVPSAVEVSATSGKLSARYVTEGGGFSPFGDVPAGPFRAVGQRNALAVVDSFDRPDGALGSADNGADWVAPAAVTISGGSLLDTTSNLAAGNLTYANALVPHVEVEAEVMWTTVSGVYLVFRLQNSSNYWMAGVEGGGVSARIYKIVGGVATQVGTTGTVSMPAGFWHKLRLVAVGDNIKFYLEDVLVTSGTDSALNTMPWVGVRTGSGTASTSHRVRNFVARRRSGLDL